MDLFSRPNKFSHAANFAIQFSHLHAADAGNAGDSSATAKPWVRCTTLPRFLRSFLRSSSIRARSDFRKLNTPRPGWSTQLASELSGGYVLPRVALVCNFGAGPTAQRPSLLSHHDVETLFHEFGHALHGMLSNVTYPSVTGTGVSRDFVELPSQLFVLCSSLFFAD
jgi:Zn-dependent oligopeptidase